MKVTAKKLIDWVKEQPPEQVYDFISTTHCPVAQFLKTQGIADPRVGIHEWRDFQVPFVIHKISPLVAVKTAAHPWTFGALAQRLEEGLAEKKNTGKRAAKLSISLPQER